MKLNHKLRITKTLILLFLFLTGINEIEGQSIFDKFEKILLSKRLQLSYGVQSSWYKESHIHFIQERYERDLIVQDVRAVDRANLFFLVRGQLGINQYNINVEIDLSNKYSLSLFTTHLGYHVNVDKEYYKIGTWNGAHITNELNLKNYISALEHSNGINTWNIGIRRRFQTKETTSNWVSFEFGIKPNIGILSTATQGEIINPDGAIEKYNPGNSIAGYNYGGEIDFRIYFKKHWLLSINLNYFQMHILKAQLEKEAYVKQNLIGSHFGVNLGYKF